MEIRMLRAQDVPAYLPLRREGLEVDAHAFGSSLEEDRAQTLAEIQERFESQFKENGSFVLGAFDGEKLVGVMGLRRNPGVKLKHTAFLWGTYVTASARGKGVANMLISKLIEQAREMPGLEKILLGVGTQNAGALALYEKAGFVTFGTERHALKIGEEYIDEYHMELWL